jgi:selT/selW/selH-like putative selenoprotein
LEAEIRSEFPEAEIKLIESSGGAFEISLNGDQVFSKLASGRHVRPGEIVETIRGTLD